MQLNSWRDSACCLGFTTLFVIAGTVLPSSTRADEEEVDVVEWVALADDEPPANPAGEAKKQIFRSETIRQVVPMPAGAELEVFEKVIGPGNAFFFEGRIGAEEMGKYWIGVECREASPELRSQLGLDEGRGLVVVRLSDDSAAAKAGLKKHDVVVGVGDVKLGHVPDLAKAVNDADGKEVVLKIIRAGKEEAIKVTPAERPRDVVKLIARPHAGMFVGSAGGMRVDELPDDVTIILERQGKKLGKITVKRGEEKWECSEDQVDKLPKSVLPYVTRFMGGPWTMPLRATAAVRVHDGTPPMVQVDALPPGAQFPPGEKLEGRRMRIKTYGPGEKAEGEPRGHFGAVPGPPPGDFVADLLKRLEKMDLRLEQMQDEIRRLRNEHPQAGSEWPVAPRGRRVERPAGERHEIEVEIDDRPEPRPNR